jgi:hypothetical protein
VEPMDKAEWEAYAEEEAEVFAQAEASVEGDGPGAAAARMEAMELAVRALVLRIKELDEAGTATGETREVRAHRKMLWWRRMLRICNGHRDYPVGHRAFQNADCGGIFGTALKKDQELRAAVERSARGTERRAALRALCEARYLRARKAMGEELNKGAVDPDRVRTRLQEDLRRVQEAGGAGTWEFFRALGRAKAALAGKRTQPKDGRPGMSAIKLTGASRADTGAAAVLAGIHAESQPMHQARGAGVAAALLVASAAQKAGLPTAVHRAVVDTRPAAEAEAANALAAEQQAAIERAWEEWRGKQAGRWAGMHGAMGVRRGPPQRAECGASGARDAGGAGRRGLPTADGGAARLVRERAHH